MAVRLCQDVRYAARSQGWRCGYVRMYGMPQGAREGGTAMSMLMTYNLKPKTYNLQLLMMFNQ